MAVVGDSEPRSDNRSPVNPVWRHRLNADYPLIVLKGINDIGQGRANPAP